MFWKCAKMFFFLFWVTCTHFGNNWICRTWNFFSLNQRNGLLFCFSWKNFSKSSKSFKTKSLILERFKHHEKFMFSRKTNITARFFGSNWRNVRLDIFNFFQNVCIKLNQKKKIIFAHLQKILIEEKIFFTSIYVLLFTSKTCTCKKFAIILEPIGNVF